MIDNLIGRMAEGSAAGPILGYLIGVLLGLSPVALPTVPAVMGVLSPGRLDERGIRIRTPLLKVFPSIVAFTAGMNGVLGLLAYVLVTVTVAIARAQIALHVLAAVIMGALGVRLLLRKTSLCKRAETISPQPAKAFFYGIAFSVSGCPGCGPIAIGVGSAAAIVAGPLYGLLIIAAFVLGHATVLVLAAAVGSRLLPERVSDIPWLRLDMLVGVFFLVASAYYFFRLVNGDVTTKLPGEPGSGLLP